MLEKVKVSNITKSNIVCPRAGIGMSYTLKHQMVQEAFDKDRIFFTDPKDVKTKSR